MAVIGDTNALRTMYASVQKFNLIHFKAILTRLVDDRGVGYSCKAHAHPIKSVLRGLVCVSQVDIHRSPVTAWSFTR